jgi:nucleotide-binding universal stress UspA family protein
MTDIVLAVDSDEQRARSQAERVADIDWDRDATSVTVLHVFTKNVEGATISQLGAARDARDVLEDAGIEVTLDETSGDPATRIVSYAEEVDAGLICVAGRRRTPTGKAVFGSVSQSVMLDSDIPVLFCSGEA